MAETLVNYNYTLYTYPSTFTTTKQLENSWLVMDTDKLRVRDIGNML